MTCITQGDQYPFVWKINYPLTGAVDASMYIRSKAHNSVTEEFPLEISDAAAGECSWDMDGTLPVGVYDVKVEVTFSDGRVIHSPSCDFFRLEVNPDL